MPRPTRSSNLYFLAFDHRGEFIRSVLGIEPSALPSRQIQTLQSAKDVILAGCLLARDGGTFTDGAAGVLIDEEYGAEAARRAKDAGLQVAMPAEAADRRIFELDHGDDAASHIAKFDPDYVKVLVRFNPEDHSLENRLQLTRLRELSEWLRSVGRKFMFELVVPPTEEQTAYANAMSADYFRSVRPALMVQAVAEIQDAGIEPSIWKVEGIDDPADAEKLSAQVRTNGRDDVGILVLSAAESEDRVRGWLAVAANTVGYRGFALGRSIWRDAIRQLVAGEISQDDAAQQVAESYVTYIDMYQSLQPAGTDSGPAPM